MAKLFSSYSSAIHLYLHAELETRAERRAQQTGAAIEEVREALLSRDKVDITHLSHEGVIRLDTTQLSFDESLKVLVKLIEERKK